MNPKLRLISRSTVEEQEKEKEIIRLFSPFLEPLMKNRCRAGILHLLINSPKTYHTLTLSKISYKLGKYPSGVTKHLEKLKKYKLVTVRSYEDWIGEKEHRKVRRGWGLNLKYPNWISKAYKFALESYFSKGELERATSKNQKVWF